MIGFRPDVLTKENNQDLYSWKEQLNFGMSDPKDPERRFDPNGALVKEEIPQEYSRHLPTVIHELNHLIDHLNSANNVEYSSCDSTSDPHILNCKIPTDSYTHFFWNENYAALTRLEEEDDSVLDNIVLPEPEWKNQWPLLGKLLQKRSQLFISINCPPAADLFKRHDKGLSRQTKILKLPVSHFLL